MTVLSDTTWKILNLSEPLQNPETSLYGPDNTSLKVLRKAIFHLHTTEENVLGQFSD